MRRHPSLIPLSRFHKRVLFAAQLAKKNSPPYPGYPQDVHGKCKYLIDFFESDLKFHFQSEEKELLPEVVGRSMEIDAYAERIVKDHRTIEHMIVSLGKSVDLENDLDELGRFLEKHVRMEEREFFQLLQEVLNEAELKRLSFKKI
jgi:predicted SAM-dependent methyltransferase